eukprot:COSAG02_NODE_5977_length_3898_cov_12.007107_3_plen_91_part_00
MPRGLKPQKLRHCKAGWGGVGMSGPAVRRKKVPKGFKPQKQVEVIDHDQAWLQQQVRGYAACPVLSCTAIRRGCCWGETLSWSVLSCPVL